MNMPYDSSEENSLKSIVKTLVTLSLLVMLLASCGGGADGPSADTQAATKGKAAAFESPPTRGVNR